MAPYRGLDKELAYHPSLMIGGIPRIPKRNLYNQKGSRYQTGPYPVRSSRSKSPLKSIQGQECIVVVGHR